MRTVSLGEMETHLSSYIAECRETPVVVTRKGQPVAVLIPAPDKEELERFALAHTPRFRRLLKSARTRIEETGGLTHEDLWETVEST